MRESNPQFNQEIDFKAKIAIITAKWNSDFNQEMRDSALKVLANHDVDCFEVPGAFEIPVLALNLIEKKNYDAVICFATVIRGATRHFEMVADDSSRGIMDVMIKTGVPVLNGILACENIEQAQERASRDQEDKGKEIALSALELLKTINRL